MRPVRADSRMPKGAMSLRNESILDGFAELYKKSISMSQSLARGMTSSLTLRRCSC